MADFGEGLRYDAVPHSEESARRPSTTDTPRIGPSEPGGHPRGGTRRDEIVFFNQSGFNRSPGKGTLFWFGNQLVA